MPILRPPRHRCKRGLPDGAALHQRFRCHRRSSCTSGQGHLPIKVGRNTVTSGGPGTVTVTEPIPCYRFGEGLFTVCLASGNQRRSCYHSRERASVAVPKQGWEYPRNTRRSRNRQPDALGKEREGCGAMTWGVNHRLVDIAGWIPRFSSARIKHRPT